MFSDIYPEVQRDSAHLLFVDGGGEGYGEYFQEGLPKAGDSRGSGKTE